MTIVTVVHLSGVTRCPLSLSASARAPPGPSPEDRRPCERVPCATLRPCGAPSESHPTCACGGRRWPDLYFPSKRLASELSVCGTRDKSVVPSRDVTLRKRIADYSRGPVEWRVDFERGGTVVPPEPHSVALTQHSQSPHVFVPKPSAYTKERKSREECLRGFASSAHCAQFTSLTLPANLPYNVFKAPFNCDRTKIAIPATTTMMIPYSAVVAPLSERRKREIVDIGGDSFEG